MTTALYDRAHLIDLLGERLEFERTASRLYGALIAKLDGLEDRELSLLRPRLEQYKQEEEEHVAWLEATMGRVDGAGTHRAELPRVVQRETRGIEEIVERARNASLVAIFHAMLDAELMDNMGWRALLEIAQGAGDTEAIGPLRERVVQEQAHLEAIHDAYLSLARRELFIVPREEPALGERGARVDRAGAINVVMSGPTHATTFHDMIRRWVDARGGRPARVREDPGILRIAFTAGDGGDELEPVSWDEWLKAFDDANLALIYEDTLANGEPSRFYKLVSRETLVSRVPLARRSATRH